eukprot:TRINITY_DN6380_c0_g1_i1.p1 TRINITY_DN6380_c0_g1~~TRINITY_DN6380_c0_g1_i1.p1  ORF type:complete len:130 (-),score=16.07 TRINITY_DN6380_c0_g1_i1:80-469(-)
MVSLGQKPLSCSAVRVALLIMTVFLLGDAVRALEFDVAKDRRLRMTSSLWRDPSAETAQEAKLFKQELCQFLDTTDVSGWGKLGAMYEEHILTLGVNGLLQVIMECNPLCHGEGHPLGTQSLILRMSQA